MSIERILRHMSYAELAAILSGQTAAPVRSVPPPGDIGPERPLELMVGRVVLEAIVEDCLAAIARNAIGAPESERAEIEALVEERVRFLDWLRGYPATNVPVALWPVGFGEGDLSGRE